MNIPEIENHTPVAFMPLYLADEASRPVLVLVARATFTISADGRLGIAQEQVPVNPAGVFWGDPDHSSYRLEPDTAFIKPGTDVALIGSAVAPAGAATVMNVGFALGDLRRSVRVFGDRFWVKSLGSVQISPPQPFERMPLVYERAFGGWDRSATDPALHTFEPRNPVGTGFHGKHNVYVDGQRLPNVEDAAALISAYDDKPVPAGFGFISPGWQPRAALAGTYDEQWQQTRMPALPGDFDRRFFNAAPAGMSTQGYLRGNEPVLVRGVSVQGDVRFDLPGLHPPRFAVRLRSRPLIALTGDLDTVVVDTDLSVLIMTWRANLLLPRGAEDVVAIQIGEPRPSPVAEE